MNINMASNRIKQKPIDKAFEKIAELKILINNQNKLIESMSDVMLEMSNQLKDLKDFKEKEVVEKEKARQGWIF